VRRCYEAPPAVTHDIEGRSTSHADAITHRAGANTLAITLGLVDRARAVHVATVPIILPT
jgi:hypothetical protein